MEKLDTKLSFDESYMLNWTLVSLGIHFGLLIFSYIMILIFGDTFRSRDLKLVKSQTAIRVDVVAMPKLTIKELKNLDYSKDDKKDIFQKKTKVERKDESDSFLKKKSFKDLVKKLSKKEIKNKKNIDEKTGDPDNSLRKIKKLIKEGNIIQKGSRIVGDESSLDENELGKYREALVDKIKPYWKLPSYLKDNNYTCRVKIFLSKNGDLLKLEIYQPSGNSDYDQRVINTVKSSAPFPPLPEGFEKMGGGGGLILGFPL
jgi:TonB family protein